jgi:transcriptional regulator with XRE-family HTH domain
MQTGELIKEKRKSKKMSLQNLADNLGISVSFLSRIENGERKLNKELIKKLCKILDIQEKQFEIQVIVAEIHKNFSANKFYKEAIKNIYEQINKR